MKKKWMARAAGVLAACAVFGVILVGCSKKSAEPAAGAEILSGGKAGAVVLSEGESDPPTGLADGVYSINAELSGGSGRATIASPAILTVEDGAVWVRIEWSSPNYDYMIVDGEKYLPVSESGNSVFEIPVAGFDEAIPVTADTTAMSRPHEVEYSLILHGDTITSDVSAPRAADGKAGEGAASFADEKTGGDIAASEAEKAAGAAANTDPAAAKIRASISPALTYSHSMELACAKEFSVDYYEEGYSLISLRDGSRFLVIPEGMEAPDGLPGDVVLICQPVENIYLAASAVMDMFVSLDALDHVRFSALDAEGWYVDAAKRAMEAGDILYAGKYSAPDYEQILAGGCGLAIENTMIFHTPEVKEQLERFGIPVLVDYSSYETEPLGRTEWVKLYGLLAGKEGEAEKAFVSERGVFDSVGGEENTGKTVAFFYITSSGAANVRKSSDYLAKMIGLAGGVYIFDHLGDGDGSASSAVTMQMEEFYAAAKEADYIIYNSTIDGELASLEELLEKSSLLGNFKAVRDGNVFCTTKNLYQSSMELGTIISDIHSMLAGETEGLTYLYRLE